MKNWLQPCKKGKKSNAVYYSRHRMNNCTHGTIHEQKCISLETTCCFCCNSWRFELTVVLLFKTSWITTRYAKDRHMPYPCSDYKFFIKFGNGLYSKEKRRAWPLPFEHSLLPKLVSNFYHYIYESGNILIQLSNYWMLHFVDLNSILSSAGIKLCLWKYST